MSNGAGAGFSLYFRQCAGVRIKATFDLITFVTSATADVVRLAKTLKFLRKSKRHKNSQNLHRNRGDAYE